MTMWVLLDFLVRAIMVVALIGMVIGGVAVLWDMMAPPPDVEDGR